MDLLTFTRQFTGPLTKYPLAAQAAEIDMRLEALFRYCQDKKVIMTKSHMRATLGIDDNTYCRWLDATVQGKNQDNRPDDKKLYMLARRESLKKWQELAESSMLEHISAKDKPAGAIFTAKAVYQYREYDKEAAQDVALGIEHFLQSMGRMGKAEKSIAAPAPDTLMDTQDT